MVELDSLDTSPFRGADASDPKSSTPTDKPTTTSNGQHNITPINPPPVRHAMSTRARPLFREEPHTYSTKKERPERCLKPPPRPPAKSCPPKSRIFKNNDLYKAQSVTFLDSPDGKKPLGTPLNPKVYNTNLKKPFFQQAFIQEGEIGAGCFGTVYKVRKISDGQWYAIKIANERYKGYNDRERKLEEVRKHQFLPPHQNLVKFYESWEEEGKLYQQFELCNGNLGQFCEKNNDIPESLVWGYLVDLLLAVQHLHNHDLIHMDIKPDNIFFGFDGRCKLGDFGLIVDLIHLAQSGYREGDSKYLAPEVLTGNVSKSCDVFSLGITILELACDLDLPSKGPLWSELREHGPLPSLTLKLSPELRRVIQLMMTRNPEQRPGVNQILELPSVAKAARRREREIMRRKCVQNMLAMIQPVIFLVNFVVTLLESGWSSFMEMISGRGTEWSGGGGGGGGGTDSKTPPFRTIRTWEQEMFSDDDYDHDCSTISSVGSELAAPLQDSSTSSSTQGGDQASGGGANAPEGGVYQPTQNRFVLAENHAPRRNAFTSPGHNRNRRMPRTPQQFLTRTGLRSPQKRLNFQLSSDESPLSQSASRMAEENKENMQEDEDDDDLDDLTLNIQPQSLAKTFDYYSDDE